MTIRICKHVYRRSDEYMHVIVWLCFCMCVCCRWLSHAIRHNEKTTPSTWDLEDQMQARQHDVLTDTTSLLL